MTEEELIAAYGGLFESDRIPASADDVRRRLVSELRREGSEATGLPSRPTRFPPADAPVLDRFRDLVR